MPESTTPTFEEFVKTQGQPKADAIPSFDEFVKSNAAPAVATPADRFGREADLSQTPFFRRAGAAMEGARKGKPLDFLGNFGAAVYELAKPEIQTLSMMAGTSAAVGAGKALASGTAKPAIGLAAGAATYYGTDRLLEAMHVPFMGREILASLAGAAAGGAAGASPESMDAFKRGGVKGILKGWIGDASEDDAVAFYKAKYGKAPAPGEERLRAQAEATAFKKQVVKTLEAAQKPADDFPNRGKVGQQLKKYTPSGETPGQTFGAANPQRKTSPANALKTPATATAATSEESEAANLESIAQGYMKKSFKSLKPEDQASVRNIAKALKANGGENPMSVTPSGKLRTPSDEYESVARTRSGAILRRDNFKSYIAANHPKMTREEFLALPAADKNRLIVTANPQSPKSNSQYIEDSKVFQEFADHVWGKK